MQHKSGQLSCREAASMLRGVISHICTLKVLVVVVAQICVFCENVARRRLKAKWKFVNSAQKVRENRLCIFFSFGKFPTNLLINSET